MMRKPKRMKPRLRDLDGTEYDPETGIVEPNPCVKLVGGYYIWDNGVVKHRMLVNGEAQ